MDGKWILELVFEYIRTRRRNVVRSRKRWRGGGHVETEQAGKPLIMTVIYF